MWSLTSNSVYARVHMRRSVVPYANWSPSDESWLMGLVEAEGSFLPPPPSRPSTPSISVTMTDRDVMERVSKLLDRSLCGPYTRHDTRTKP